MSTNNSSRASKWKSRGPVTGLVLDTTLMRGSLTYLIPASLCNLSSLITLSLSSMYFEYQNQQGAGGLSGYIPHCIGTHLTNLVVLDLNSNRLTGPLPHSFSHLQSLQSLDLMGNSLSGPLPHSFSYLQSLQSLALSGNSLSGWLPPSFGLYFPNLTSLDLSTNSFSGPLPSFSSPLLQFLDLRDNLFSGVIGNGALAPHSTFTSLSFLDLSYNYLSGEIPNFDLSRFPSLASLDLSANLLSGSVPDSICGLTNLTFLALSSNSLSGSLLLSRQCRKPMFAQGLTVLDISYNEIEGLLPEWIGSLTNLESLDLSYNRALTGSLPNSWQNLSLLQELSLSGISLVPAPEGSATAPRLPSWCFLLPALQYFSIGSLRLQATDLDCSSLLFFLNSSRFQSLDLSSNHFSSDLLQCLSNFSRYDVSRSGFVEQRLILSENPLDLNINLPEAIQLLPPPFDELDMASCGLSGHLSGAFFDGIGPSVGVLSLADNHLKGQIPAHLGNLSRLVWLDLSSNYLEGQVPAELGSLGGQLYWLDLSHNYLSGIAPFSKQKLFWGNMANIKLSSNHLAGKLSSLLENLFDINACTPSAEYGMFFILDVSTNLLTGSIPPWLRQCSVGARFLYLHNNRLEGSIPNELFANNALLRVLSLGNNNLSGQMPQSIAILTNLWVLDLSHNRFTGSLETSALFGNASSDYQYMKLGLRVLLLGYNDFTGSVPPSLAVIAPALQIIDLSNNHLTGTIPVHTLCSFLAFRTNDTSLMARHDPVDTAKMHSFSEEFTITVKGGAQSYQYLRGGMGEDVHGLPIAFLDLSGNRMSGALPTGLGELSGLTYLNLSRNRFSGPIPPDLGKLSRQLQSLDLSNNELVGPIPASFRNLAGLEVFNVSYNPGLSGPIPQNQPQFETAASYIGDPNLCGDPVLHSCRASEPATAFQSTPAVTNKRNAFAEWIDEWVSIPGLCLGTVIGFVGVLSALEYFHRE